MEIMHVCVCMWHYGSSGYMLAQTRHGGYNYTLYTLVPFVAEPSF